MAFIAERDRVELKRRLQKDLQNEVSIRLFTQPATSLIIPGRECQYCGQTQQVMEELASLSPKLKLEVVNYYASPEEARKHGVERIPAIVMSGAGESNIKFYGFPGGNEFMTIVEAVSALGKRFSGLQMDTRKKLKQVNQPVHVQVFVTPT